MDMAAKVDWAQYLEDQEKNVKKLSELQVSKSSGHDTTTASKGAGAAGWQKIIRKGKGLVESKSDIEVQRHDPNSSLYSVKTFEALNLKPNLLKGVYEMGFIAPSKIQKIALPTLLADPPQNLLAQSQPGTGKTVAFILAMLSRVDPDIHYPQVLCLSPTYELAVKVGELAAHIAKFCPEIELKYAVQGEEMPRGAKVSDHIIIGTPGIVLDWGIKYRAFDLSKITVFVLNEADILTARLGYQYHCIKIHKCLDRKCQIMFFCTTYDQEVVEFFEVNVPNPLIITLKRNKESFNDIQQYYVTCANKQEKYDAITNIYGTVGAGKAIIFCDTKSAADWLSEKMTANALVVAVLTGSLTVEQKIAILDIFQSKQEMVLITTINIVLINQVFDEVRMIVNYDLPVDINGKPDCETYLCRIEKLGRFGRKGIAINLIDSAKAMLICQSFQKHTNQKIVFLRAKDFDKIETISA